MNLIRRFFPISLKGITIKGLLAAIFIYVMVNAVGGFVLGLFSRLPLIGFVASFAGWALSAYCAIGIIAVLLLFFGILR